MWSTQALTSQPSGGRSVFRPASAKASCARSASSGLTRKSTSCSVSGPPRAQHARPPPSTHGTPASLSRPPAFFIASSSPRNSVSTLVIACAVSRRRRTWNMETVVRIAAAGDVHASEPTRERSHESFTRVQEEADLVLLAGDLTTHGEPAQAAVLADACRGLSIPVCAILGNHDLHEGRGDEVSDVLQDAGVNMLDRESAVYEIAGTEVGIAGAKG